MARTIFGCLVALILVLTMVGCPGQGSSFSGDGGAVGDSVSDSGRLGDVEDRGDGTEWPDGTTPPDGLGDDAVSEVLEDGGWPDQFADGGADGGEDLGGEDLGGEDLGGEDAGDPGEPWAPCSAGNPCSDPQICLLLPGSETDGICVVPCVPGDQSCPPSQDCIVPDPDDAPDTGYCFLPAGHLEPCDVVEGRICSNGRYCLAPMAGGVAVCTDFCIPDEALCPDLTACAPVSEEGVAEGWGACLPEPAAVPCSGDLECANTEICVTPAPGATPTLCMPACDSPGAACTFGGTCMLLGGPGGEAGACLHPQDAAEWCDPFSGWICDEDLVCLEVDDPTGFGRCAAPCVQDADCEVHEVCAEGKGPGDVFALGCLPPSLTGAPSAPCNDAWPCPVGEVCVEGACAPTCDDGCPGDHQVCQGGGCVHTAPVGHGCASGWGWLCADGLTCASDEGASSGICAMSCGVDDDCPPGKACLPGPDEDLCLDPISFGDECSFSVGAGCADDGHCMFLGSGATGFCTAACPGIGQGGCPAGPPGTLADCMLNSGGQTWCAFLCGPFGSDCPDGMTCDASGVCLP